MVIFIRGFVMDFKLFFCYYKIIIYDNSLSTFDFEFVVIIF